MWKVTAECLQGLLLFSWVQWEYKNIVEKAQRDRSTSLPVHLKLHTAALVRGHKVFEGAHLAENLHAELPECHSHYNCLCAPIQLRAPNTQYIQVA